MDSLAVKVHPDGTGALPRMLERPQRFALSPSYVDVAPEGRKLLRDLGKTPRPLYLLLWTAHTKVTRPGSWALDLGFISVVPTKENRVTGVEYNRAMYKRRNEIERLFRRLKGFPTHLLALR